MKKVLITILITVLALVIVAGVTLMSLDHDIEIFGVKISPPFSNTRAMVDLTMENGATAENDDGEEISITELIEEEDEYEYEVIEDTQAGLYTDDNGDVFLLTQRQADSGKYHGKEGAATEKKLHIRDELFSSYKPAFCDNYDMTWVNISDVDIIDEELYKFETYSEAFEATEIYDDEYNVTHRRYDHQYDGVKVAVFTLWVEDNAVQKLALFYQEEFGYCFDVEENNNFAPVVTEKPTTTPPEETTPVPTPTAPEATPTPTPTAPEATPTPTPEATHVPNVTTPTPEATHVPNKTTPAPDSTHVPSESESTSETTSVPATELPPDADVSKFLQYFEEEEEVHMKNMDTEYDVSIEYSISSDASTYIVDNSTELQIDEKALHVLGSGGAETTSIIIIQTDSSTELTTDDSNFSKFLDIFD